MRIALDQIEVLSPSQNIDEEQLQGLADSMKHLGLSHSIVVRPANELGKHYLVTGEKRYLAAKLLGWPNIPCEVREMDDTAARELRLHENLKRFNLPWHEQVVLIEELHSLRQSQHGMPVRTGRPSKDEEGVKIDKPKIGWSIRDTAKELQVGVGPLSEDLSLARALRIDPTLAKVQDKKTALRLARIAIDRIGAEAESRSPSKMDANEIYLGDSAEILKNLPSSSVDHCVTDPPWIKFFEPRLTIDERTLPVFKEIYRVLKPNAFLYLVCGLDDYVYYAGYDQPSPDKPSEEKIHVPGKLETIGFHVANTPLIWQKKNSLSRRGVRSWEYDRDFEFIIVAAKGSPAFTTSRRLSGFKAYPIVHPSKMIHPNEKPVALLEDILADCSYENEIIVDPFGGSGVLAEACAKTKRKYIVCERDKKSYDLICKRMGK